MELIQPFSHLYSEQRHARQTFFISLSSALFTTRPTTTTYITATTTTITSTFATNVTTTVTINIANTTITKSPPLSLPLSSPLSSKSALFNIPSVFPLESKKRTCTHILT